MLKYAFAILFFTATVGALSIQDQLNLYLREGENYTSTNYYALNSSFHLLFVNCQPIAVLEESNGDLAPVQLAEVEDLLGEYIRRGYKGCYNETLQLNSSTQTVLLQMPPRSIEATGKLAALEREDELQLLWAQREAILRKIRMFREVDFNLLDQKLDVLSETLRNLRRVKSESSISRLKTDFDQKALVARELMKNYDAILPYYYPAAAALANATIAVRNAERRYGEDDPRVQPLRYELLAISADLTAIEKDMAIGAFPSPEQFSRIAIRSDELRGRVSRIGSLIPPYLLYAFIMLGAFALAAAIFVKFRTPKKIAEEDVPKIRKLLNKLRGLEQQEEELR